MIVVFLAQTRCVAAFPSCTGASSVVVSPSCRVRMTYPFLSVRVSCVLSHLDIVFYFFGCALSFFVRWRRFVFDIVMSMRVRSHFFFLVLVFRIYLLLRLRWDPQPCVMLRWAVQVLFFQCFGWSGVWSFCIAPLSPVDVGSTFRSGI